MTMHFPWRPNCPQVWNTGDGHGLPLLHNFRLLKATAHFIGHRSVLFYGVPDVVQARNSLEVPEPTDRCSDTV